MRHELIEGKSGQRAALTEGGGEAAMAASTLRFPAVLRQLTTDKWS
jgi:hypothetical protein